VKRIPELDGLRGLAILMVVLYHYFEQPLDGGWFHAALGLGWTGVDLFFVLSGFLIGGILLDARGAANYFQVFYTRRFYRIVPLYLAILILFPAVALATGNQWLRIGNTMPWYYYWTFTQNFWMAHTGRFGALTLAVTWSLAIEEQFYLTLPFLINRLSTARLHQVIRLGIYTAPVLRIGIGLAFPHNWIAPFALMPCRMDALLLGVLAALLVREGKVPKFLKPAILVLGLGPLAFTRFCPTVDNPLMQSFGYTWMALFYTAVLLYAVTQTESRLSRVLRTRWLGWLGGLAYGVYLFHENVLGLVFGSIWGREPFIDGGYSLLTALLAVAITLALASASWRFFEKPLLSSIAYKTKEVQS
jgi:peptidoglycan/LPS O-acetylase OafA/YrhL